MKDDRVYRFCDGEIVDGLNRRHYNPQNEEDLQIICTIINTLIREVNKNHKENQRLKDKLKDIVSRMEKLEQGD